MEAGGLRCELLLEMFQVKESVLEGPSAQRTLSADLANRWAQPYRRGCDFEVCLGQARGRTYPHGKVDAIGAEAAQVSVDSDWIEAELGREVCSKVLFGEQGIVEGGLMDFGVVFGVSQNAELEFSVCEVCDVFHQREAFTVGSFLLTVAGHDEKLPDACSGETHQGLVEEALAGNHARRYVRNDGVSLVREF